MELDIRHLRFVLSVDDHGSLSAAARALGMAQPAVSTQLRRIEESLGGALFERSSAGVHPTERGREVLLGARRIMERIDRIEDAPGSRRAPAVLRLRTFVLPIELMLPLLQHLVPGTRWEFTSGGAQEGVDAVAAGEADLYPGLRLDDLTPAPPGVVVEEVLRERGWIMLPAGHRLAKEPIVDMTALSAEAWVTRPEPEMHDALVRDCRRAGFEPNVQFRSVDQSSLTALVGSGSAVALISPVADVSDAVVVRPCNGSYGYSWVLAYRPDTVSATVVRLMRDLLRWAYWSRASTNPELVRMLPPELLAAELPQPMAPAAAGSA